MLFIIGRKILEVGYRFLSFPSPLGMPIVRNKFQSPQLKKKKKLSFQPVSFSCCCFLPLSEFSLFKEIPTLTLICTAVWLPPLHLCLNCSCSTCDLLSPADMPWLSTNIWPWLVALWNTLCPWFLQHFLSSSLPFLKAFFHWFYSSTYLENIVSTQSILFPSSFWRQNKMASSFIQFRQLQIMELLSFTVLYLCEVLYLSIY